MDGGSSNNNKIEEMKLNSKENDHKFALIAVIARAAAATAIWAAVVEQETITSQRQLVDEMKNEGNKKR